MKPLHAYYYKNVTSGRVVFVLFEKGKNGDSWSNQEMSVKMSSISDLKPFSRLKGKKVRLGNCEGVITMCYPQPYKLDGKYHGESKYLTHKELLNMNELVCIHWTKGVAACWQPFYKLELL